VVCAAVTRLKKLDTFFFRILTREKLVPSRISLLAASPSRLQAKTLTFSK